MRLRPYSVAVLVKSARKSLRWYTQKLGFDILDDDGHWVVVGDKKRGIGIHLCQDRGRGGKPRLEPGNTGILIVTEEDITESYEALRRKGVHFTHPLEKTESGWFCMFEDPDGNEFWLNPSW
jgi:catechol 2,3-dioxygenase-like lactoylglutathione lyase family enzyme